MSTAEPDHMNNLDYVPDKDKPWFLEKPQLQWPARCLLEKYSNIPPEDVEKVVIDFRDRAWETFPFPCIGAFDFLDFWPATRNLLYPRLLARLKDGATFLDIGCCLGHDIRKLVFDGVPGENHAGVELRQGYIDLGYEFFRDKEILRAKIYQGNVLEPITSEPWLHVEGRFDVVNLGLILHVFEWDEQVALFERAIATLKRGKVGTTITGLAVVVVVVVVVCN